MHWLTKLKGWKERGSLRFAEVWFALFCSGALVLIGVAYSKPPNYVVMHDVHVLDRLDEQAFRAEVIDPATREWNSFVVKSCPEFVPTHEIKAGATLTLLQYVEDRTRSCDELDGKYAGYILLRGAHGEAIYSDARSPAASTQTTGPKEASTRTY